MSTTLSAQTAPLPVNQKSEHAIKVVESKARELTNATEIVSAQGRECTEPQKRDVRVQLHYLANDPLYDHTKPLQITPNFMDREGRTNIRLTPGEVEIMHDIRGREHEFTLDQNGFRYLKAPTSFKDWSSQPKIGQVYLKEMEALLKNEIEGCDEIIFYDARIRQEGDGGLRVEGLSFNPFARQVHVDNTETSVIEKIKALTEMKSDYLLRGRAQIINIWRPIKHPVYDCGLAIADGGNLRDGDVLECDRHRQDTGKYWDTMGVVKYRSGFHWYYMSEQDEEDILLFKNYDSARDVPARHCLHTAFDLPSEVIPANAPTRESVEVRALVFTHPQDGRRMSAGTLLQQATAIPHPLAETLERSELKRIDDELTITDRRREDIDEANEIKDAVLLLRKREIKHLERVNDGLHNELERAQQQIQIQRRHSEALEAQVAELSQQLKANDPQGLRAQIQSLSAQLVNVRLRTPAPTCVEADACTLQGHSTTEIDLLHQRIDKQGEEVQKWKAEAMGRGSEAVSRCYRASIDEAIRQEREKDAFVVKSLQDEIARLKESAAN